MNATYYVSKLHLTYCTPYLTLFLSSSICNALLWPSMISNIIITKTTTTHRTFTLITQGSHNSYSENNNCYAISFHMIYSVFALNSHFSVNKNTNQMWNSKLINKKFVRENAQLKRYTCLLTMSICCVPHLFDRRSVLL